MELSRKKLPFRHFSADSSTCVFGLLFGAPAYAIALLFRDVVCKTIVMLTMVSLNDL